MTGLTTPRDASSSSTAAHAVRVKPRAAPDLCATQGGNGSLVLAPCSAHANAAQDWSYNYTLALPALCPAVTAAPSPSPTNPWNHFTPGQVSERERERERERV
jgi:hypothetical protein